MCLVFIIPFTNPHVKAGEALYLWRREGSSMLDRCEHELLDVEDLSSVQ